MLEINPHLLIWRDVAIAMRAGDVQRGTDLLEIELASEVIALPVLHNTRAEDVIDVMAGAWSLSESFGQLSLAHRH